MQVLEQIWNNKPIWNAFLAWFIAQVIKTVLTFLEMKKLDASRFYGAGGMPSSHTALVIAMTVTMGRIYGFDSGLFAISVVLSLIVMYDAAGIRRAAGLHAKALNQLFSKNGLMLEKQLKELLGHTPLQVFAGAVLGIVVGILRT